MEDADLFGVFDEAPRGAAQADAKRAPAVAALEPAKAAKKPRADGAAAVGAKPGVARGAGAATAAQAGPAAAAGAEAPAPATLSSSKAITHEVALPPGEYEVDPSIYTLQHPPRTPAREWPFELDPFQKAAIGAIERNESVLVAAHTSAGKTVCAEYAIASALRDGARVIYTSPIKALSNQKYRELHAEFGTVGLMTGDVTINPHAECLVMTTEILRSMLYRGSEVMREVAWVVFDEVHYLRDKERGVVWEETMIMVPGKVRFVFLSATIPNALEFASWVATLHRQPCHVVYTDYRPTPLKHYVFAEGGSGLHLVKEGEGAFKQANYDRALADLLASAEAKPAANKAKVKAAQGKPLKPGAKEQGSAASDIARIVKIGHALSLFPMIVFALSKKECEALALGMDRLDMTSDAEKEVIGEIFANAIEPLSDDDKALPQVAKLLPILRRGIGIHHGGLLPLIKEVVELLFQEGLTKVLFATETFAMGLNMPARTVVFANARKFDGEEFRLLSSGEYIQMSGRAGRRGIDSTGIVIFRMERKASAESIKSMIVGSADNLSSAFHLSYNMVLNCLRLETADVQTLMRKSFFTFQAERALPGLEDKRAQLEGAMASASAALQHAELCDELAALRAVRRGLADEMRRLANTAATAWPFIVPGRMASVRDEAHEWGWGVVVDAHAPRKGGRPPDGSDGGYTVDMLVPCCRAAMRGEGGTPLGTLRPAPLSAAAVASEGAEAAYLAAAEMQVVRVRLDELDVLSSVRVLLPRDVRAADDRHRVLKSALEVLRRFEGDAPALDPKDDLGVTDAVYYRALRKAEALDSRLASERCARKGESGARRASRSGRCRRPPVPRGPHRPLRVRIPLSPLTPPVAGMRLWPRSTWPRTPQRPRCRPSLPPPPSGCARRASRPWARSSRCNAATAAARAARVPCAHANPPLLRPRARFTAADEARAPPAGAHQQRERDRAQGADRLRGLDRRRAAHHRAHLHRLARRAERRADRGAHVVPRRHRAERRHRRRQGGHGRDARAGRGAAGAGQARGRRQARVQDAHRRGRVRQGLLGAAGRPGVRMVQGQALRRPHDDDQAVRGLHHPDAAPARGADAPAHERRQDHRRHRARGQVRARRRDAAARHCVCRLALPRRRDRQRAAGRKGGRAAAGRGPRAHREWTVG